MDTASSYPTSSCFNGTPNAATSAATPCHTSTQAKDSIMNLLADRETTAVHDDSSHYSRPERHRHNPTTTSDCPTCFHGHRNSIANLNHSHHDKTSPGKNTDTNPSKAPPPIDSHNTHQVEIVSSDMNDMEVARAPTKRLIRQRSDSAREGVKRRKAHVLRYITTPQSASMSDP
jgi:hypothetical protein